MTMTAKLAEANRRYDEALRNYMTVSTSDSNAKEFIAASKALNEVIDEKDRQDRDAQDAIRLVKNVLKADVDSILRSLGNGKAYEDPVLFLRALCNDVESATKRLTEIVGD